MSLKVQAQHLETAEDGSDLFSKAGSGSWILEVEVWDLGVQSGVWSE